jgi:hypothetical protein
MPRHSYKKVTDNSDELGYKKTHEDGRVTTVGAAKGDGQWRVLASDSSGSESILGSYPTKQEARKAATEWMSKNPDGFGSSRLFGGLLG